MRVSSVLMIFNLTAMVVSKPSPRIHSRSSAGKVAMYWGQNGGGTMENDDLAHYCTSDSGVDIIILSFLYEYGNGNLIPSGTIGQSCSISTNGEPLNCNQLGSAIETCQSHGINVILSLGGGDGAYSLQSRAEAETIGQNLWDAYGNTVRGTIPRPFGKAFVNGWDFDIEFNNGSQYYPFMISALRSNFESDPAHSYYITGAPQCFIPEPNMASMIQNAKFDQLWVQFYNNPSCSAPQSINYDKWVNLIQGGQSANADIFLGLPASPAAAGVGYLNPGALAEEVEKHSGNPHWGGIMLWDAGFSDANVQDGCTFAQQGKNILNNGPPCSNSSSGAYETTPTTTPSPGLTPTATKTLVSQWGQVSLLPALFALNTDKTWPLQCGGRGYRGSTICASPWKCVRESIWWSSCHWECWEPPDGVQTLTGLRLINCSSELAEPTTLKCES